MEKANKPQNRSADITENQSFKMNFGAHLLMLSETETVLGCRNTLTQSTAQWRIFQSRTQKLGQSEETINSGQFANYKILGGAILQNYNLTMAIAVSASLLP